ncbi:MAG: cytidylate kinase family protein [Candidatus Tectomicrobia bacterium]|uniref:Cytidylate kinase family protein n=1 Tax=Tectimicrobiota bacterium TaxID=2528274 RepID=A0A932LYZ0_UNCTE|nr:cytidylate kinase family protein [Candidatus Tectomicrobia bacterium]
MPIVAFTREYGSGATAIAMKAAQGLGYEYIRDQITKEAAETYGVAEDELIAVVESKRGFWDSLAEETQVEFALLASEVYRLAEQDNVVIMGRWATLLLRSIRHCIRVRVCAPMETRIPRVMARRSLDRDEAAKLIRKADEGASSRIRQFFDVQWGDPLLYDLVVNSERVPPDLAVQQILELARHPEFQPTEDSRAKLRDRSLEARIRAAFKADRETMRLDLIIVCESGNVALKGLVFSGGAKEAAEKIAKSVDGIRSLDNQIRVYRE